MKVGSLFTGGGGLDMAVHMLWPDAQLAWVSEVDRHASSLLAERWPDVQNLGDITAIDWTQVEPVDVIVGGFPCQDISHAGKQAGISKETRSGLWFRFADAVRVLRPRLVLIENVAAITSLAGALDAVLGELAEVGFDAEWGVLRASDVGACHQRARWFCVAYDPDRSGGYEAVEHDGGGTPSAYGAGVLDEPDRHVDGWRSDGELTLLPTVRASDSNGPGVHGDGGLDLRTAIHLLPTPAVNDMGRGKTVEQWDEWTARMQAKHGNGNGHGKSLEIEAQRLLPTPTTQPMTGNGHARHLGGEIKTLPTPTVGDSNGGRNATSGRTDPDSSHHHGWTLSDVRYADRWGDYAAAIARHEAVLGRPAPGPTDSKGRLSARFVEWMMGWPDGWTDSLTRAQALKVLGNGVVPRQAAVAFTQLLARVDVLEEAA